MAISAASTAPEDASKDNNLKPALPSYILRFFTHYVFYFFILSILSLLIVVFTLSLFEEIVNNVSDEVIFSIGLPLAVFACIFLIHLIVRNRSFLRFKRSDAIMYSAIFVLFTVTDLIVIAFTDGLTISGPTTTVLLVFAFPFFPFIFLYLFGGMALSLHLVILSILFFISVFTWIVTRNETATTKERVENTETIAAQPPVKKLVLAKALSALTVVALVGAGGFVWGYMTNPAHKYSKGHGFEYMNGYSSTDFTDYTPYAEPSKLVMLDHKPSLVIDNEEDMPVLDGAEACYPLYSSVAKNVYTNIAEIEQEALDIGDNYISESYHTNGKIVSFTNSAEGYQRLLNGEVDIFFGAKPSENMVQKAKEEGKEFRMTPIGREGFVFFVEKDNPVENITTEQMKAIYSGEITNWKEVGGSYRKILAFQRPSESGSQIMMEHFMGDVPLKNTVTYETVGSMGDVIDNVAEYGHDKGAIGYTFRYFLEGLHQEEGVKMLSIDGVYPSVENISNGTYPLVTDLYAVTLESNDDPNVQAMLDFLVSPDGQEIVERSGYAPLH